MMMMMMMMMKYEREDGGCWKEEYIEVGGS
jgi:hypothetical protein